MEYDWMTIVAYIFAVGLPVGLGIGFAILFRCMDRVGFEIFFGKKK